MIVARIVSQIFWSIKSFEKYHKSCRKTNLWLVLSSNSSGSLLVLVGYGISLIPFRYFFSILLQARDGGHQKFPTEDDYDSCCPCPAGQEVIPRDGGHPKFQTQDDDDESCCLCPSGQEVIPRDEGHP